MVYDKKTMPACRHRQTIRTIQTQPTRINKVSFIYNEQHLQSHFFKPAENHHIDLIAHILTRKHEIVQPILYRYL